MVQPEYAGNVVVELIIHSTWADKEYLPIKYPAMYEDFIRLRNPMRQDGLNYVIPQGIGLPEVAGVVGIGKTIKQAIQRAEDVADSIEAMFIEKPEGALDKAMAELEKAKSYGLDLLQGEKA
jgi:predicted RNase H-like HicB family nuclease